MPDPIFDLGNNPGATPPPDETQKAQLRNAIGALSRTKFVPEESFFNLGWASANYSDKRSIERIDTPDHCYLRLSGTMVNASTPGVILSGVLKTASFAAPISYTALIKVSTLGTAYTPHAGVFIGSPSGKFACYQLRFTNDTTPGFDRHDHTNATSTSVSSFQPQTLDWVNNSKYHDTLYYYRITYDGANLKFEVSPSEKPFWTLVDNSPIVDSHFLSGDTPDRIGIYVQHFTRSVHLHLYDWEEELL